MKPDFDSFGSPRRAFALVGLALALGACSAIGPTGTNKAKNVYKAPDENGVVVLTFKAPSDVEAVVFSLRNPPEGVEFTDLTDDSKDGTDKEDDPCKDAEAGAFCVSFKPADQSLPGNIYLVDVKSKPAEGEDEGKQLGTVAFIVKADEASTDGADTEDGGGGDAAAGG